MPYKDKEKQKAYLAEHYKTNKGQYAESSRAARLRKRELMKNIKSGPCTDCSKNYPFYVMHFDHTGTDKVMDVSKVLRLKAWQTVLDEIAKCELVCANCHAERTYHRLVSGNGY